MGVGVGLQRQRQDREERTNPFKLQKLSCSSTGHVWVQRMNFDGTRESRRMIEVEMGGVACVCVCVLFYEKMIGESLASPQGFDLAANRFWTLCDPA